MYIESFESTDEHIPELIQRMVDSTTAEGVPVVDCLDVIPKSPNAVVLNEDQFLLFLRAAKPLVAFVYRVHIDVQEAIDDKFDEDLDEDRRLRDKFVNIRSDTIKETSEKCEGISHFKIFALFQSHIVSCNYISSAYLRLMSELESFHDGVDKEVEAARSAAFDRLSQELLKDPEFAAIRGKRKRCVYVANKYGDKVFFSGYLARPDARSEPMDRDLVDLVEHVSDLLALGLEP